MSRTQTQVYGTPMLGSFYTNLLPFQIISMEGCGGWALASFPSCHLLKSYGVFLCSVLYTKVPCLLERGTIEKQNLFSGIFNSHNISSTKGRELLLCMSVSQPRRKTMVRQPETDKQTPAANCSPEVAEAGYKRRKITVRS